MSGLWRSTRTGAIAAILGLLGAAAGAMPARASGLEGGPSPGAVSAVDVETPPGAASAVDVEPSRGAATPQRSPVTAETAETPRASNAEAPRADSSAVAPAEPRTLRSRGPRGDRSAEVWDFAFAFESGDRLLLRFAVTNIGPGNRNAAAVWHWVDADGGAVAYDNGQRAKGWRLEEDARRIRIKSSVLDLRRPTLRLSMGKKRAKIELRVVLPAEPLHEATQDGDQVALWATHAPAEGTYWTRGMEAPREVRGTGSLVYSWLVDERREQRRVELLSFDSNLDLYAIAILRESGLQDTWAIHRLPDGERVLTRDVALCPGNDGDYIWPARLQVASTANLEARVEAPFLRSDPVAALPGPVATLVRLVYKPMRLWSSAAIEAEGRASPVQGAVRTSFGNPLSRSAREALGRDPRCRDGGRS